MKKLRERGYVAQVWPPKPGLGKKELEEAASTHIESYARRFLTRGAYRKARTAMVNDLGEPVCLPGPPLAEPGKYSA